MNKNVLLSLRIDSETSELITFLKQNKVRYTDIIRPAIIQCLKEKCIEFEYKEPKYVVPF
jgi:hypothetical protein